MKKISRFLAVLLAAALLAGCGSQPSYEPISDSFSSSSEESSSDSDRSVSNEEPDSSSPNPDSSAQPAPTVMVTEPPLDEWALKQPIPDFLNEEQRQLFLHAYCAVSTFLECSPAGVDYFPLADGSLPAGGAYEYVEVDGMNYTISRGRYRQWNDFRAMMNGLFTPEYQQELIGDMFRPTEDGLLCYLDVGRGSDIFYDGIETDTYELVSQTKDEICFDLIGHYTEWDYDPVLDEEVPGDPYTTHYPIRMVRTDQGWRVAEIHVPW